MPLDSLFISKLTVYQISAKNKYGWGPPSSTFTFYNKGVGSKSKQLRRKRDQLLCFKTEKCNIYHFSARLFNPADQVQGAKSGQGSEEGIFQYNQEENIIFQFCVEINHM